jgi:hypothetical protein
VVIEFDVEEREIVFRWRNFVSIRTKTRQTYTSIEESRQSCVGANGEENNQSHCRQKINLEWCCFFFVFPCRVFVGLNVSFVRYGLKHNEEKAKQRQGETKQNREELKK